MVDEKEKEVKEYQLVQVPSQYGLGIQTPEGDVINPEQAQVLTLNLLREIAKKL